ncbi:hypothetical protein VQ643_11100 [Pseudomonas sp. F1_0610]|uniref:hypothetical protein n=1 Tax=Pseudomonas sp. F1_0610 TaxID=3114284 RepID=UPI0039C09BAC
MPDQLQQPSFYLESAANYTAVTIYDYECQSCSELQATHMQAQQCCIELVKASCPCCWRIFTSLELDFYAVQVAAHCNFCNPHFTLDQLTQIHSLAAL